MAQNFIRSVFEGDLIREIETTDSEYGAYYSALDSEVDNLIATGQWVPGTHVDFHNGDILHASRSFDYEDMGN